VKNAIGLVLGKDRSLSVIRIVELLAFPEVCTALELFFQLLHSCRVLFNRGFELSSCNVGLRV